LRARSTMAGGVTEGPVDGFSGSSLCASWPTARTGRVGTGSTRLWEGHKIGFYLALVESLKFSTPQLHQFSTRGYGVIRSPALLFGRGLVTPRLVTPVHEPSRQSAGRTAA
jgi:hypothetical protein